MPDWRRNLWVVSAATFVTMAGMSAFIPFFPDVLRELGISSDRELKLWSGFLTAAAPLSAALMGPLWGALGDRLGHKLMITRSLGAIAVFVGLMGVATSPALRDRLGLDGACWLRPWPLLWLRLGQGVFSGFLAPALTLVSAGAPEGHQGRVAAVTQTSLVAGTVVGPALGAWIAVRWGPHMAFLCCAAVAAAATALVALAAIEGGSEAPSATPRKGGLRQTFVEARENLAITGLSALMIGLFLAQTANALLLPVLRLHVEGLDLAVGEGLWMTGIAFSATALGQILLASVWGGWADRVGARPVMCLSAALGALSLLAQALVTGPRIFLGLRFVQGAAMAGTVPAAYAHVGRLSGQGRRGGAFGLLLSAFQIAGVAGPVLGGSLAASLGTRPLFVVSGALLLASSAWIWSRL